MSSRRTGERSSPRRSSRSSPRKSGIDTRRRKGIPSLVVLFGPTAVGKSDLLASILDPRFEVISADSMQVYRSMDVGTAKPSAEMRTALPHHLIDVVEPSCQFNAGLFVKRTEELVDEIRRRGRIPLVSGGTAFYITSFLYGLPESPPSDAGIREELQERAKREGREALYDLLVKRDPQAAARIHPGDVYRITRALEVLESTGNSVFSYRWPRTLRADLDFLVIGLDREREELYARIDQRVDIMFSNGLVEEVKSLLERGFGPADPGMRGIGYREILSTRSGCLTLGGARELIKRNSRRYAKRQLTFFRTVPGVQWFHPRQAAEIKDLIGEFVLRAEPGGNRGAGTPGAPPT